MKVIKQARGKNYDSGSNAISGFSLVELMVVVAIIGILVSLAVPRYKVFMVKAHQSEAATQLSTLYTLQIAYYSRNNKFYSLLPQYRCSNDLGFSPGCVNNVPTGRYKIYHSTGGSNFVAEARSGNMNDNLVNPGCKFDSWIMDSKRCLCSRSNSAKNCDNPTDLCQKCVANFGAPRPPWGGKS